MFDVHYEGPVGAPCHRRGGGAGCSADPARWLRRLGGKGSLNREITECTRQVVFVASLRFETLACETTCSDPLVPLIYQPSVKMPHQKSDKILRKTTHDIE